MVGITGTVKIKGWMGNGGKGVRGEAGYLYEDC